MKWLSICKRVLWTFVLFLSVARAQIVPPYYNKFNQTSDTVGWKHYAISGSDDWAWGVPSGGILNSPLSTPKVWATSLIGNASANSHMVLESPSFDLSNTSINWRLTMAHQHNISTNGGANVEYSIDNGNTWLLLNGPATEKYSWYNYASTACTGTSAAFSFVWATNYKMSIHKLDFLSGQSNVKIRMKLCNVTGGYEGWMIDNFYIEENKPNLYGMGFPIGNVTKNCPGIIVYTDAIYTEINVPTFTNQTKYFLSANNILDAGDLLLTTTNNTLSAPHTTLAYGFNLPAAYQNVGTKYLFVQLDALNNMNETLESDNIITYTINVDSVYNVSLVSDFEPGPQIWTTNNPAKWIIGPGDMYGYENGHVSMNGFGNLNNLVNQYQNNYIETPLFDSKLQDSTLISFWYRSPHALSNIIQFNQGCPGSSSSGVIGSIAAPPVNYWGFTNKYFPQAIDTSRMGRIRILNGNGSAFPPNSYLCFNLLIDDIYIGSGKPDLSLEFDTKNRYSPSNDVSDTISYVLFNSGPKSCQSFSTSFYWSTDSLLDNGDVFLGLKSESSMPFSTTLTTQFIYNKPTTTPGKYYVLYFVDSTQVVNEMREYNNKGYFIIHQDLKQTIPYYNDFETQINGWRHSSLFNKDEWKWVAPSKTGMNYAYSGTKAWVSNDTGYLSPISRMQLYTPIFDLSNTTRPAIEFDMLAVGPGLLMSYSTDNGVTWKYLDSASNSFSRWYYRVHYDEVGGTDGLTTINGNGHFARSDEYNGRDCKRTYKYIMDIKRFSGINKIQFRFDLTSSGDSYDLGAMIDNFAIKEGMPDLFFDYKKSLMISSNSNKIKFNGSVRNAGNYVAKPGILDFYLSTDNQVGSDVYLGSANYGYIRPDNYAYFNQHFNAPLGLSTYKYLIIRSDVSNTSVESDETNNDIAWPLALDSLKNSTYFNNFNDTIINGWYGYSEYQNAIYGHRVRNQVPPAGSLYFFWHRSGELFTDQVGAGTWDPDPTFYIESPKFDFSGCLKMEMFFKMMCTGIYYTDGGIMEYSINGGNTFSYLNLAATQTGYGTPLSVFGNLPGWSGQIGVNPTMSFTPVQADLSFLSGRKDVVLRFKYKSNHYFTPGGPHGLRIDDFGINVKKIDYVANNLMENIIIPALDTAVILHYNYSIVAPVTAPSTKIKFYWSVDSIFGSNDSFLHEVNVASTTGTITLYDSLQVNLNQTSFYNVGYVFYKLDQDSTRPEGNEFNNLGSFKILNDVGIKKISRNDFKAYCYMNNLFVDVSKGVKNPYKLFITDASGRKVSESVFVMRDGKNTIPLPETLAKGLYLITFYNEEDHCTLKYIVN